MMAQASSPPPIGASSLGYMNRAESDEPSHREAPSRSRGRWRSKSRPWEGGDPEDEDLRAGDELTVIERHSPGHRDDDYDWYDDQGMRVKVREISRRH